MEIQNARTTLSKSNQLKNVNIVRLESRKITTQPEIIDDGKALIPTENSTTNRQYKNATEIDYTTTVDQLRTVTWTNDSHPTGVVKSIYGYPTSTLNGKPMQAKGHTFKKV